MGPKKSKTDRNLGPLKTRDVFLDTQVYRSINFSADNRAMTILRDQIDAHKVVIHTTDIGLLEIKRQIREQVEVQMREVRSLEKNFSRWRHVSSLVPESFEIDAEKLTRELFDNFRAFIAIDCKAEIHRAYDLNAETVFEAYFRREAPFDGEDSKEFPDAFMLKTIEKWCADNKREMYVVSKDSAMLRAAEANDYLIPSESIHDIFEQASAGFGKGGEEAAEVALNAPNFDYSFEEALRPLVSKLGFAYSGDLPGGDAFDGELLTIEEINDWSVVGLAGYTISLVISAVIYVSVEVQYDDLDYAAYDKEDDQWFGAEASTTTIEDKVEVKVFLEANSKSGDVSNVKMITQTVRVRG